MVQTANAEAADPRPWWDLLVRLTHWGIALAVVLNGLIDEGGSPLHVWIGYGAVALLALRLVWGLVGTPEARFSAFPPSLSAARAHVRDLMAGRSRAHRSHNPLGALNVYAMWGALAIVAGTGMVMAGSALSAPEREAPAAERSVVADDDHDGAGEGREEEGEEAVEEVHEIFANLLLILAALHVGGVALESRLSGRNLARDMTIGGRGEAG